jgi:[ribosomal protein S18]-alanine N-acetyltransferase
MFAAPTRKFSGKALEAMPTRAAGARPKIRGASHKDIPALLEIVAGSPEAAAWSEEAYAKSIGQSEFLCLVSERGETISGFLIARRVVAEGEILNVAVRRQSRQQGHGGALLRAALKEFQRTGIVRIFLEVRESNATAIAFYAKHGFVTTGKRSAYYRAPTEDAVCMKKELGGLTV